MRKSIERTTLSVILPVHNCERTITAAAQSVISQSFRDWELIVIDDGSDDATLAQLTRLGDNRIQVSSDGLRKGLPARLNEGIDVASGKYIARMDGDDVCFPDRFECQLDYLQSHPDVDLVGGGMLVFGDRGEVLGQRMPPERHDDICRWPFSGFPMAHPTFLGRTNWFRQWRFHAATGGACDQDLLLRSYRESRFGNIPRTILGYREHTVALRKCLRYRMEYACSLLSNRRPMGLAGMALGLALIAMKSGVDVVAVATGLQHRLLRHRAMPVTDADLENWHRVWQQLVSNP